MAHRTMRTSMILKETPWNCRQSSPANRPAPRGGQAQQMQDRACYRSQGSILFECFRLKGVRK